MAKKEEKGSRFERHHAARPLKYVTDKDGSGWLCDSKVDASGDLAAQGCWRCEDMAFPCGGR